MSYSNFIAVALTCFVGINAYAGYYATPEADCTPIDLRQNVPMKVRNQNHFAWCYAYSSSDFLQYHYKLPEPVSAIDLATSYGYHYKIPRMIEWVRNRFAYKTPTEEIMNIDPPEQGVLRDAMKQIVETGYCPESVFPSDAWKKVFSDGKIEMVEARRAIRESDALSLMIQNGIIKEINDLPYYYELPDFSKIQYFQLISRTNYKTLMPELQSALCDGKRKSIFSTADVETHYLKLKGKRAFNRINESLDRGDVASVDFFATMLIDRFNFMKKLSSMHTVLVMGRKYDPELQECRYTIRDTHGTDCLSKSRLFPGRPFDPSLHCEGGYHSVPESSLYSAMISYSYFEPNSSASTSEDTYQDSDESSDIDETLHSF